MAATLRSGIPIPGEIQTVALGARQFRAPLIIVAAAGAVAVFVAGFVVGSLPRIRFGGEEPQALAPGGTTQDAVQDFADRTAALVAGGRYEFALREERLLEERTGCAFSFYAAFAPPAAEAAGTDEAVKSARPLYDLVATARTDAGKRHVGIIVGASCPQMN